MRLTALTIKNFKCFGERGYRIQFAPITLLFGPNNAGKSTIIQALHLAQELLCNPDVDLDSIDAKRAEIHLGTFKDYVHKHDLDREVVIGLEYTDSTKKPITSSNGVEFFISFDKDALKPRLRQLILSANGKRLTTISFIYTERGAYMKIEPLNIPFREATIGCTDDEYNDIKKKVGHIWSLKRNNTNYEDELNALYSDLYDKYLSWLDETEFYMNIFSLLVDILESEKLACECVDKDEFSDSSLTIPFYGLNLSRLIQSIESITYKDISGIKDRCNWNLEDNEMTEYMERCLDNFKWLISKPLVSLSSLLKNFFHIGPLRTVPLRNALYERKKSDCDWFSGLAAWREIAFLPDKEFDLLNRFLNDFQFLNTNYQLIRERFLSLNFDSELARDFLDIATALKNNMRNTNIKAKLYPQLADFLQQDQTVYIKLFDTLHKVKLDPHDMGVGISQVLPCLASAATAQSGEIVAIEQPELHIHPAWQTSLADIFIHAIKNKDNPPLFLLETHSEHFLLRLLRRIRQTHQRDAPQGLHLNPDELAVHWIGLNDNRIEIYVLLIDEDGSFLTPWPEGFFEERAEELFG